MRQRYLRPALPAEGGEEGEGGGEGEGAGALPPRAAAPPGPSSGRAVYGAGGDGGVFLYDQLRYIVDHAEDSVLFFDNTFTKLAQYVASQQLDVKAMAAQAAILQARPL